jgi:predicted MFS family arabinose efflux permease
MMLFGVALAVGSSVLVPRLDGRVGRRTTVVAPMAVFVVAAGLFMLAPAPLVAFAPLMLFGVAFAFGYPPLLGIYSASVPAEEQGWVMGVSTALFTLGAGITSFVGGWLTGLDLRAPFLLCMLVSLLGLALVAAVWRTPEVRRIVG